MADKKKKAGDQSPAFSHAPLPAMFLGMAAAKRLSRNGQPGAKDRLDEAERLRTEKAHTHREIFDKTGVTFGKDHKSRFEMSDHLVDSNKRFALSAHKPAQLSDVISHPNLFRAVPTAGLLSVSVDKNMKAEASYQDGHIKLNSKYVKAGPAGSYELHPERKMAAIDALLHEVQHHVQDQERFDGGASTQFGRDQYHRSAGEVEARLTSDRRMLTPAERRQFYPTGDVPLHDQLLFDAKTNTLREKVDMTSLKDAAHAAMNTLLNRDTADGKVVRFRRLDPGNIKADPATFQFKSGGDNHGVTDRLKGVKTWDQVAAGKAVVFEKANGEQVIADGHQRLGLAKRLSSEGQHVKMDAYVLREHDGWTPKDAYAYAALKNIKESSGNALDMAKVMRERPDLVNGSVPMSDAKVRDASHLSKLSKPAFDMVIGGAIKPEYAAQVGARVGDQGRHADMLAEMAKAGIGSTGHAGLYVDQALAAGSITEHQNSLFGEETHTRSLVAERAAVLDKALSALKTDKRIFSLLEREAGTIEGAGNRLSHEANAARAGEAGTQAALVERLAKNRGPVSDMLDAAARQMAEGKKPQVAARAFVKAVGDRLKSGGISALTGDAAPMVAEHDPNQMGLLDGSPRPGWGDNARQASAEVRQEKAKGKTMKSRRRDMGDQNAFTINDHNPKRGPMPDEAKAKWEKILDEIPEGRNKGKPQAASKNTASAQKPPRRRDMADESGPKPGDIYRDRRGGKYRVESIADGKVNVDMGGHKLAYDRQHFDSAMTLHKQGAAAGDMFGGPKTKDLIDAASRAKEAKGRVGDAANHGLFSDARNQTDLVDMAKQAPKDVFGDNEALRQHMKGVADSMGQVFDNVAKQAPVVDPIKVIDSRNQTALAHAEVAKSLKTVAPGRAKQRVEIGKELVARNEADLAKLEKKPATKGAVTEADLKPGAIFMHKGGKLYKIDNDYQDKSKPRFGWATDADGKRLLNNERSTSSVFATQWQVNDKHPQGREYQAARQLKIADLRPVEAPKQAAPAAAKYDETPGIADKAGNVWRKHENSSAWSVDRGTPAEKPATSGLHGTQNASNLEAINANKAAKSLSYDAALKAAHGNLAKVKGDPALAATARTLADAHRGLNPEMVYNGAKAAGITDSQLRKMSGVQAGDLMFAEPANNSNRTAKLKAAAKTVGKLKGEADARAAQKPKGKAIAERPLPPSVIVNARDGSDFMKADPQKAAALDAKRNAQLDAQKPARVGRAKAAVAGTVDADYAAHKAKRTQAFSKVLGGDTGANGTTDADKIRRYTNRMKAAGTGKTDAELSSEALTAKPTVDTGKMREKFAAEAPAAEPVKAPRGKGGKALGILAPVAIAAGALIAAKHAKAAGAGIEGQVKAAGSEAALGGVNMAAFGLLQGGTTAALVRGGLTLAKAVPGANLAMMGVGAVMGATEAGKGHRLEGALKGAWDFSLPGMVVNTGRAVYEASKPVSGPTNFDRANAMFQARHATPSASDSDNLPGNPPNRRGYANPKIQALAKAAQGKQFNGFTRSDLK